MKTANNRGQRIAYEVHGSGPPVVLQHGLLSNRWTWSEVGYVEALGDAFQLICTDSLGHGESDKPHDPALYQREQRAGDIAAVLDAEGIEKAHYIGYSMGGWIGSGMAVFQPQRLLSLTIGGWDPIGGPSAVPGGVRPNDIDAFLKLARDAAPQLTTWITDDVKPGLAASWEALTDVAGSEEALERLEVPILLWAGKEDGCYEATKALAARMDGIDFHEVPGEHVPARLVHVKESVSGLRSFLDRVSAVSAS